MATKKKHDKKGKDVGAQEETTGTVSVGKEDLTEAANELKTAEAIAKEAKGQLRDHLDNWAEKIYEIYKKSENELTVSISLSLKGDSQEIKVKSKISFSTGKITDETEGEVALTPRLPLD